MQIHIKKYHCIEKIFFIKILLRIQQNILYADFSIILDVVCSILKLMSIVGETENNIMY